MAVAGPERAGEARLQGERGPGKRLKGSHYGWFVGGTKRSKSAKVDEDWCFRLSLFETVASFPVARVALLLVLVGFVRHPYARTMGCPVALGN